MRPPVDCATRTRWPCRPRATLGRPTRTSIPTPCRCRSRRNWPLATRAWRWGLRRCSPRMRGWPHRPTWSWSRAAALSGKLDQADLVRALDIPVILVVGLRLGCLNHAYLSARAIAADGCRLAGWIGTGVDPDMARIDDNRELLAARLPAPCLGW